MKIMISQPMNGKTEEQIREERASVVSALESKGHTVIDTVFTDETPQGFSKPVYFLSKSIEALSSADAVVFLPGWEKARGCRIDHIVALEYGKYVRELNNFDMIEFLEKF